MIDLNGFAQKMSKGSNNAIAEKAMKAMNTEQGKNMVQNISPDMAKQIEIIAKSAQSGDKATAMNTLNQIMSTSEGENLAKQIKQILGK